MATEGQHVGGVRDNLTSDDGGMSAARAQARALAALAKPQGRTYNRSAHHDIGDGDPCPMHGRKMLVIRGTNRQHCPDQSHDGQWSKGAEKEPRTRAFWPLNGFEAAVKAYRESSTATTVAALSDIDMEGF